MTEPVFHESRASMGHERGRSADRLALVALAILIVLIIKPWGPTPEPAAAPLPPARPTATPALLADLPCAGGLWLVEADTRWAGHTVRSWILTDAATATGPTDPAIPFVVVAGQQVLAVGYCPPYLDDRRPHEQLTIYRLTPTVSEVPTTIVRVPREAEAAANELFAPLSTPGPNGQAPRQVTWSPGRYVLRIETSGDYERWLGFEIRIIGLGTGAPTGSEKP